MTFHVRSIEFTDEGVQFSFVEVPDDLRSNGMLLNHALYVPERAMPDELDALAEKAQVVLTQAMYQHQKADPVDPSEFIEGADDDDAPGPYDNPEERNLRPPDPPPAPPGERVG